MYATVPIADYNQVATECAISNSCIILEKIFALFFISLIKLLSEFGADSLNLLSLIRPLLQRL